MSRLEHDVVDNTINDKCSQCGDCCPDHLPMTKHEVIAIRKYVKDNNIKPTIRGLLELNVVDAMCPFLTLDKKCKIYEVRPNICKMFKCNLKQSNSRAKANKLWYKNSSVRNVKKVIFEGINDNTN